MDYNETTSEGFNCSVGSSISKSDALYLLSHDFSDIFYKCDAHLEVAFQSIFAFFAGVGKGFDSSPALEPGPGSSGSPDFLANACQKLSNRNRQKAGFA